MVRSCFRLLAAGSALVIAACGPPPPADKPATGAGTEETPVVVPVPETTAEPVTSAAPVQSAAPDPPAAPAVAVNFEECIARLRDSAANVADPSKAGGASDYLSALTAERSGALDQARRGYLKLIQTSPDSALVPAAYFAFGEMFLAEARTDPSKLAFAEQSYKEAMKYPAPANSLHAAALYRMQATPSKGPAAKQAKVEQLLAASCR